MAGMNRLVAWMVLPGLAALRAVAGEANLQLPPAHAPTNAPQLSPLLVDAEGAPIKSREEWLRRRAALEAQWGRILGPLPDKKVSLQTEYVSTEETPGFTRQYVRYQLEAGLWTDGYLLTPKPAKGKLPAVVVFHPTTPLQAKGVAGLSAEYPEEKWQGVQLAQRGYVAWCPRNYIETEGTNWAGNAARVRARHPDWNGMTRMVWDAIRAADFVSSLPLVQPGRLGCLGHSLGGKEVIYAMAFDDRYRVGVSSEGGIGLKFSNWDAPWYFGDVIQGEGFAHDHHELLGLIAPRAFLLLAGESADGDRSWSFLEAALPVYELYGARANLGWFNHHQGHRYGPEARAVAEEFLDRHLKP